MKLLIMGHSQHGKDVAAHFISEEYDIIYANNSLMIANYIIIPESRIEEYEDANDCYNRRHQHRPEWLKIINKKLDTNIMAINNMVFKYSDIRCGLRLRKEFEAIKNIVDLKIWVHRPGVPLEQADSCQVTKDDADIILLNDGSIRDLISKIAGLHGHFNG